MNTRGRQTTIHFQYWPQGGVKSHHRKRSVIKGRSKGPRGLFARWELSLQGRGVEHFLRSEMRNSLSFPFSCRAWMYCEYQCQ